MATVMVMVHQNNSVTILHNYKITQKGSSYEGPFCVIKGIYNTL